MPMLGSAQRGDAEQNNPKMKIFPGRDDIALGTIQPSLAGLPILWLTPEDQEHHATIWGQTGSGKSFLLLSLFLQHLNKGHGVGLIDPHPDLTPDIISQLIARHFFDRPEGFHKLVVIDWGSGYVTPNNVLGETAGPPPLPGQIDDRAHSVALNLVDVAYRVWPELRQGAPLFKQLYTSTIMALKANHLPLSYMNMFFENKGFRQACLGNVTEPTILQTWQNFDRLQLKDQLSDAGSTMRRAWDLTFHPILRLSLGTPDSVIRHRYWMDHGIAFIHYLGKVKDRLTRQILGALLMVDIEQAAMSRIDQQYSQRRPCTLLVDEWGYFAAQEDTIGHILSETRKYGLRIYLSAQNLSLISSERLAGALENCKIRIVFGLGRNSAEATARDIGEIDPARVKEEALSATQHNLYASILEQREEFISKLQNLDTRVAYVKLHNRPVVKMRTLGVRRVKVDQSQLDQVFATYRRMYQRTVDEAVQVGLQLPASFPSVSSPTSADGRANPDSAPSYARLWQSRRNDQG